MSDSGAKSRFFNDYRSVESVFTAASGLMRTISIKRFSPRSRRREFDIIANNGNAIRSRCHLFKEKGWGWYPTIVIGGFVPDATETVEFQRKLLRRHGSVYYMNYSRTGFCQEMFNAQLADLIDHLERKRKNPVIMAISFGCGLLASFLRHENQEMRKKIRGIIMISPVLTIDDLVRNAPAKSDGVRILESNLKRIMAADPESKADIEKHINRSRRCFQGLFNAGAGVRELTLRHLAIRKKVNDVIEGTSAVGSYERVRALRDFCFPESSEILYSGPMQVLFAEKESDFLIPTSPTIGFFSDKESYRRIFPRCRVETVISGIRGDGVPHASLVFHHEFYNGIIEKWYLSTVYPDMEMAV